MTFGQTLEWQRCNNFDINRLAKLGDVLAKKLIAAYAELYRDRLNPRKQDLWMKYCNEFATRDLLDAERRLLISKYGHKIPEETRPKITRRVH